MRRIHWIMLAAMLPVQAIAQDAVIRIEAKRGPNSTAAAIEGWQAEFDDVVTFPLSGGWTAIGLGPMNAEAAQARMQQLKSAGKIPADSFVATPGGNTPIQAVGPAEAVDATAATPAPDAGEAGAEGTPGAATDTTGTAAPVGADPAATAQPGDVPATEAQPAPPPPPEFAIRLEAFPDRAEADAALAKWRETFPEAGLWQLPNDWFAIAVAPLDEAGANAWLAAFKRAERAPSDAFVAPMTDMGGNVTAGQTPDLPAPGTPQEMPPMDEVQRALRWAGHYDGDIDGKPGPMTRAAIASEMVALRLSPDEGTAMRRLIERRAEWQREVGLTQLDDPHTGLSVTAPMDRLVFDRNERALSIYAPKDGSGAALILFSQPGGQQELLDMAGLITALGWVPAPKRDISNGHVVLSGRNEAHLGHAEGWVREGRAEGYVLIWPASDAEDQPRIAAELSDSLKRTAPGANEPQAAGAAPATAPDAATAQPAGGAADAAPAPTPVPAPATTTP